MIINYLSKFYNVSVPELKKFLFLGAIFGFTIGIYWMLSPLRDSIFCMVSSVENIPSAKIVAVFVIIPLAMLYSWVVDHYSRSQTFYVLCAFYGTLALIFAYFFAHPIYGLHSDKITKVLLDGRLVSVHTQPFTCFLGWVLYIYVESFSSLMVVLFWSFASDITTPESAKRGFGLVAMGAQLGGVFGPFLVKHYVKNLGEAVLIFWAALAIFVMAGLIYLFMKFTPAQLLEGYRPEKNAKVDLDSNKTGFLAGFKLLVSQPYLLSIFAIISIFEIILAAFDFKLRLIADQIYTGRDLSVYFSNFGMYVNLLGLACLIFGVSKIGSKLGVRYSLLILPILVSLSIFVNYLNNSLLVVWFINVAIRAFNYAFNQPIKEQLYIPTSHDTKYKAKAWIEMFGARGSKLAGSGVGYLLRFSHLPIFMVINLFACFGLMSLWMFLALYLGRVHQTAIKANSEVC
jgi:AAA family ATP:ADP antiporter